jgi:hypothetical protein
MPGMTTFTTDSQEAMPKATALQVLLELLLHLTRQRRMRHQQRKTATFGEPCRLLAGRYLVRQQSNGSAPKPQ